MNLKYITPQEEIKHYSTFQDGWDEPGSKAPSSIAISRISKVLLHLPSGILHTKTMLSSNGNVGLYWHQPNIHADLEFEIDGSASFFSRKNSDEFFKDELTDTELTTDWLHSRLNALFQP